MTNDFYNTLEMLEDFEEIIILKRFGVLEEEIIGYLEFFAVNKIQPLSSVFGKGEIDV